MMRLTLVVVIVVFLCLGNAFAQPVSADKSYCDVTVSAPSCGSNGECGSRTQRCGTRREDGYWISLAQSEECDPACQCYCLSVATSSLNTNMMRSAVTGDVSSDSSSSNSSSDSDSESSSDSSDSEGFVLPGTTPCQYFNSTFNETVDWKTSIGTMSGKDDESDSIGFSIDSDDSGMNGRKSSDSKMARELSVVIDNIWFLLTAIVFINIAVIVCYCWRKKSKHKHLHIYVSNDEDCAEMESQLHLNEQQLPEITPVASRLASILRNNKRDVFEEHEVQAFDM